MAATPADRSIAGQIAAAAKWAQTPDYSAATAPARAAFNDKFEREVDPHGVLPIEQRQKMAEHARRLHFLRMAQKSVQARKARDLAARLEAEVAADVTL